jgi:hypothetical protein
MVKVVGLVKWEMKGGEMKGGEMKGGQMKGGEMKGGEIDRMRGWIGGVVEVLREAWREVRVGRGIGQMIGVGKVRMNGGMVEGGEEEIVSPGRREIIKPETLI